MMPSGGGGGRQQSIRAPTPSERLLEYMQRGEPPIFTQAHDFAVAVDIEAHMYEAEHLGSPLNARYFGYIDQMASAAHSFAKNIANGHYAGGNEQRYWEARGSLGEVLTWLPVFPPPFSTTFLEQARVLQRNFDDFFYAEMTSPLRQLSKSEGKEKDHVLSLQYLRAPVAPLPAVAQQAADFQRHVLDALVVYITQICHTANWRVRAKFQVEELSKDVGAISANICEGWARCSLRQNWGLLKYARGKVYAAHALMQAMPHPFCTTLLGECDALKTSLNEYAYDIVRRIAEGDVFIPRSDLLVAGSPSFVT